MSNYPEHDKMHAVKAESQAIGEFLEWLGQRRSKLPDESEYNYLLSEFFEIDLTKIEDEKRDILRKARESA